MRKAFRAKRIDNGEWIVGDLVWINEFPVIFTDNKIGWTLNIGESNTITFDNYEVPVVDKKTVGMFSGLKDIHENEIFKGDIVRSISNWGDFGKVGEVVFDKGKFLLDTHDDFFGGKYRYKEFVEKYEWKDMGAHMEVEYTYEVIGNIYDNPELLKQQNKK